jgi:hypothetical protein
MHGCHTGSIYTFHDSEIHTAAFVPKVNKNDEVRKRPQAELKAQIVPNRIAFSLKCEMAMTDVSLPNFLRHCDLCRELR